MGKRNRTDSSSLVNLVVGVLLAAAIGGCGTLLIRELNRLAADIEKLDRKVDRGFHALGVNPDVLNPPEE